MTYGPVSHYRVGFKSGAGFPVLFDMQHTFEGAKATAKRQRSEGHKVQIYKVTTEEVEGE